jgi:hypothetical protein
MCAISGPKSAVEWGTIYKASNYTVLFSKWFEVCTEFMECQSQRVQFNAAQCISLHITLICCPLPTEGS